MTRPAFRLIKLGLFRLHKLCFFWPEIGSFNLFEEGLQMQLDRRLNVATFYYERQKLKFALFRT